jgi:hypothetical protein
MAEQSFLYSLWLLVANCTYMYITRFKECATIVHVYNCPDENSFACVQTESGKKPDEENHSSFPGRSISGKGNGSEIGSSRVPIFIHNSQNYIHITTIST